MKNILLAILSIAIGFVISIFTLGNPSRTNNTTNLTTKKQFSFSQKEPEVINNNTSTESKTESLNEESNAEFSSDQNTIEAAKNNDNIKERPTETEPKIEDSYIADNTSVTNTEAETTEKNEATLKEEDANKETVPDNLDEALTSYEKWKAYSKAHLDLMATFTPLDENGVKIKKGIFLTLLRTGGYIPIKSKVSEKTHYQLSEISNDINEKIKKNIISNATNASHYFKMEGKKLPSYNFVDINGKAHNKRNTKGKFLVLKCWFITCKTCVEEFPQLNNLVDKYKNKKIEFVSLAFDEKDKLKAFLDTKTFKYSTVANQKEYMSKKLKVKQYPTHLIIDSNGVIMKMVNNVDTLTSELERIFGK